VQSVNHTAVLVFAESVEVHAKRKTLRRSKQENHELFQELTRHSLKVARRTGFDVYHYDESNQIGDSFAKRLSNALHEIYDLGYQKVVVMGSDCPDLTEKDILKASSQLDIHQMVIGPDLRGGIFLLGISREAFQKDCFEALSWQTSNLRKSFLAYAENLSARISWLAEKTDFNHSDDLDTYWTLSRRIRSMVNIILNKVTSFLEGFGCDYSLLLERTSYRRGPPFIPA